MGSLMIKFDGDAEPQLLHVSGELPLLKCAHPVYADIMVAPSGGMFVKIADHPRLNLPDGMELVVRRSGDAVEVVTRGRT